MIGHDELLAEVRTATAEAVVRAMLRAPMLIDLDEAELQEAAERAATAAHAHQQVVTRGDRERLRALAGRAADLQRAAGPSVAQLIERALAFFAAVEANERNPRIIAMRQLEQEVAAELAGLGYHRGCRVCEHGQRLGIEADLRRGSGLGAIATRRGLTIDALARHRRERHAAPAGRT